MPPDPVPAPLAAPVPIAALTIEPRAVEGRIRIPYRWPAGRTAGAFLARLRDEGRLYGLRCPRCKQVAVPPRPRCLACRVPSEDWVAVGPEGELLSWTTAPAAPARPAEVWALVRLDGADTALFHRLLDVPPDRLRVGLRVRADVASPTVRRGAITDLIGFCAV
ncbi:MAG: OB-fold domain-containing protein [Planctomycetes bacterium]|nr:OB-fold domain-containing protein [Planctomycetota bacterium]